PVLGAEQLLNGEVGQGEEFIAREGRFVLLDLLLDPFEVELAHGSGGPGHRRSRVAAAPRGNKVRPAAPGGVEGERSRSGAAQCGAASRRRISHSQRAQNAGPLRSVSSIAFEKCMTQCGSGQWSRPATCPSSWTASMRVRRRN